MKREVAFHPRVGNFRGECPIRETGRHSHCTQDEDGILRLRESEHLWFAGVPMEKSCVPGVCSAYFRVFLLGVHDTPGSVYGKSRTE